MYDQIGNDILQDVIDQASPPQEIDDMFHQPGGLKTHLLEMERKLIFSPSIIANKAASFLLGSKDSNGEMTWRKPPSQLLPDDKTNATDVVKEMTTDAEKEDALQSSSAIKVLVPDRHTVRPVSMHS